MEEKATDLTKRKSIHAAKLLQKIGIRKILIKKIGKS
jgi:hypothetical protein